MNPRAIAVVGLGLMGGSLAAACRRQYPRARILGVSRKKKALSYARRKGWIHESSQELSDAAACDLVILCAPVDALPSQLDELEKHARRPLIVTDVGSVKGELVRFADSRRWKHVRFIGAHPMVGSHRQGIEASRPDLYRQGLVFVTPSRRSDKAAARAVSSFWQSLGLTLVRMAPDRHDGIVSQISHLPHAAASVLLLSVDPENLKYAGSGFRDTTRIAASHPSVWLPIFLSNRRQLLKDLRTFGTQLSKFTEAVRKNDAESIRNILMHASERRAKI